MALAMQSLHESIWDHSTISVLVSLLTTACISLWWITRVRLDAQEPPLLKPTIPVIGHIVGLLRYQLDYFIKLARAHEEIPICTLPLLNRKAYMITSPDLIQSCYSKKTLSFEPFGIEFSGAMLGLSEERIESLKVDMHNPNAATLLRDVQKTFHSALHDKNLDHMNGYMLPELAHDMNELGRETVVGSFYLWMRDIMTLATTTALHGVHNPYKDRALIDALWEYDAGIATLVLGIAPSVLAARALKARSLLQKRLTDYYQAGLDEDESVCQLARGRAENLRKYGWSTTEIGQCEIAMAFFSTSNTMPTMCWVVLHILSSPELTEDIRSELLPLCEIQQKGSASTVTIHIRKITEDLTPLLVSTYREVLRCYDAQTSTRRVMEDTVINDDSRSYLLKKGADLQIPSAFLHYSEKIWGSDAQTFNPRRFLKGEPTASNKGEEKQQRRAYIPFGGGRNLCPGKEFAFNEITGLIVILVVGWDVSQPDETPLKVPGIGPLKFGQAVLRPDNAGQRVPARMVRREGWENVTFGFVV